METIETNLPEPQPEPTDSTIQLTPSVLTPPLPSLDSPWIISIRQKLDQARQIEESSPCATLSIYRVPKTLRNVDETAYTPQIVSIGPYHHGLPGLRDMDHHKWRALHHALARTGHDVRLYLDAARSLEDRARACYEAPLSISSDDFVESLVLDAIFVLEFFLGYDIGFLSLGYTANDPVFAEQGYPLQTDMIKLENQVPLFVLDGFLALQLGHEPSRSGLVAPLALSFFNFLSPNNKSLRPLSDADRSGSLHCLDLFRRCLVLKDPNVPSWPPEPPICCRWFHARAVPYLLSKAPIRWCWPFALPVLDEEQWIQPSLYCVSVLRNAGIKFRRRKSDMFWDIEFKDGVLHIPRLYIHDSTKTVFRNLIAFEQCHPKLYRKITSYACFMDDLINSEADVRYLHDRGIIDHCLGDDGKVADLFNQLCKEVCFNKDDSHLSKISEQVNCYYKHRWNVWRASLCQKYFSNPWTIISLVAALILLLLTAAQTFYSVYGYYKLN